MKYFTWHIKSSFAKKILQIYTQCMWDSFFLVHAPEGVIENYVHNLSSAVFMALMLVGPSNYLKQIIQMIEPNRVKNPIR